MRMSGMKEKEPERTVGSALVMLGCPEVPIQTSAALYLVNALGNNDIATAVAGTKAARALLEVADPQRVYLTEVLDLDHCIAAIAEGERTFDLCFVFVHNDAGVAYSATMAALLHGKVYAIIFGDEPEELGEELGDSCEKIIAPGRHNPLPLKRKIDKVMEWAASKR